MQVIVVDDGQDAAANRREITANAGLVIQYFVLDHDTGIAAARNFAISKVRQHFAAECQPSVCCQLEHNWIAVQPSVVWP